MAKLALIVTATIVLQGCNGGATPFSPVLFFGTWGVLLIAVFLMDYFARFFSKALSIRILMLMMLLSLTVIILVGVSDLRFRPLEKILKKVPRLERTLERLALYFESEESFIVGVFSFIAAFLILSFVSLFVTWILDPTQPVFVLLLGAGGVAFLIYEGAKSDSLREKIVAFSVSFIILYELWLLLKQAMISAAL